jgi:hypothetical protein
VVFLFVLATIEEPYNKAILQHYATKNFIKARINRKTIERAKSPSKGNFQFQ